MAIEQVLGATTGSGPAFNVARLASSAATVNTTVVKGAACKVYRISGANTSASLKFLKLYNSAAPVVGTNTPRMTLALPVGVFEYELTVYGQMFETAFAYAITANVAETDSTAVAAGDVVALNITYL